MRILHSEASEGWGGQDMRVLAEARAMAARGHYVALACTPGCPLWVAAQNCDVACEPLRYGRKLNMAAVAATRRLIKKHDIEIVNTHSSADGWSAAVAARLCGVPCVRTRHLANAIRPNLPNKLLYGRLTDFVITTGEAVRRQIMADNGVPAQRIASVPTGVDTTHFDPARWPRHSFREELGAAPGEFIWGMVAMIRRIKGHADLVEAAALLPRELPVRFVMVGEAPEGSTLVREMHTRLAELGLAEKFVFVGYREDIASILAGCDGVVLPSHSEGLPQALTQALAMAKPVVATAVGGVPEIVHPEETGLLVPPHDPPALAGALRRIVEQPQEAAATGARGRSFIVQHYGLEAMTAHVEAIYRELLTPGGKLEREARAAP